ncbi:MAG: hypothetical protein JJU02_14850 [Cryomorphaceae bacterium]|nr:hypothetical protein [Cryomorphaceae bacterium]
MGIYVNGLGLNRPIISINYFLTIYPYSTMNSTGFHKAGAKRVIYIVVNTMTG